MPWIVICFVVVQNCDALMVHYRQAKDSTGHDKLCTGQGILCAAKGIVKTMWTDLACDILMDSTGCQLQADYNEHHYLFVPKEKNAALKKTQQAPKSAA